MLEEDIAKSATLTQPQLKRTEIHGYVDLTYIILIHKVQYKRLILQSNINNVMKQGKTHSPKSKT